MRASTLSKCQWNVATALTVMRGGEPTAALDYLRGTCQGEERAPLVIATLEEKLRTWWRAASWRSRRLLIDVEGADAKKKWVVAKARRFLAECYLERWLEDQNIRIGITPMSSLVLEKGKHELRIHGIASAKTRKAGFQWLRRWRRRCGVRLRELPVWTPTDEEMAQKAMGRGSSQGVAEFGGWPHKISAPGAPGYQKNGVRFPGDVFGPLY